LQDLFVVCHPSFEDLLFEELKELGISGLKKSQSGVYVPYNIDHVFLINYCSRIATRVLLTLKKFKCPDREVLYQESKKIQWDAFLRPELTFAIDANVHGHAQLRNSLFVAQIIKDAICDQLTAQFGSRPSVNTMNPDVQLNIFIHQQDATLSFDTSGSALFKRGYRKASVEAPLQETMAAALLKCAGYNKEYTLWDPFCGSGTFLIESAMIATQTPAGFFRSKWGFAHLPDFSQEKWTAFKYIWDQKRIPLATKKIFGSDKDPQAIEAAEANLSQAGFTGKIELLCREIDRVKYPVRPNFIVTNPPFGKRLERSEQLFRSLAQFIKDRCEPHTKAFMLFPQEKLHVEELSFKNIRSFYYGGLDLGLYQISLKL
jgi:putative N6-adenine-specific DNA methylase